MMTGKLSFVSDYMEGAHPQILNRLTETNLVKSAGYGFDEYSESAREKIRNACGVPEADVFFLAGGTQANAVLIDALLRPYQGVISAQSGHINVHEAGAIEYGGHKVLALPHQDGRITADSIQSCIDDYWQDENHEHMVMPGMVYISQPTEYGTLYSLDELSRISKVCRENNIPLYLDGARLAYALACPENDVSLTDLGRLCDAFYIGGTKCGALFGEAVVIPRHNYIPHLFTIIKQHGALLAKGRIAAIQFDTLFTNGLYLRISDNAIRMAMRVKALFAEKGIPFFIDSPTNQQFPILTSSQMAALEGKVAFEIWERLPDGRAVTRFATSWATREEAIEELSRALN